MELSSRSLSGVVYLYYCMTNEANYGRAIIRISDFIKSKLKSKQGKYSYSKAINNYVTVDDNQIPTVTSKIAQPI